MSEEGPIITGQGEAAPKEYRKGMRDLGCSLIVLATVQLVVGGALLAIRFNLLMLLSLGGMAGLHILMGALHLRNQGWANYLVAAWAALLMLTSCVGLSMQPDQPQSAAGSILDAFEKAGWPEESIAAPLPRADLVNALRELRRALKNSPLYIGGDGTKNGLSWRVNT